jgi:competence protein ComEC
MLHRPLVPMLLSCMGGIFFAHEFLGRIQVSIWLLTSCLAISILVIPLLPPRTRILYFVLPFFLAGLFLGQERKDSSPILNWAFDRKRITIEGTVLEPMTFIGKGARVTVRTAAMFFQGKRFPAHDKLLVTVYDHVPQLDPGEKIRFPARLRPFKNFNNPGSYDYKTAMRSKGFSCAASVSDGRFIVPMGKGPMPFLLGTMEKVRRPVRDFFRRNLNEQDNAVYRALVLGERQGIGPELREVFSRTGLGHVLAVSGLHIGLVGWIAFFLSKWCLSRSYRLALTTDIRKLSALLTCFPVIVYTGLAGFQVSAQRAMIMALAFLWSLILNREKDIWSTFALAGLVILALEPQALFSVSFQLSFVAVVGILWLTPAIWRKMPVLGGQTQVRRGLTFRISRYFLGLIVVSFSAVIFLLPITTYYFHRIPIVSILSNIMVIPILGLWVLPLGLLSTLMLPFSAQGASFLLYLGTWGLQGMMEIIEFWAALPWASFWVITPNLFEMTLFYSMILLLFCFGRWTWAKKGIAILALLILCDVAYWAYRVHFNKYMEVTFLDVGQGNAALVEFPSGKRMLIDGGGFPRGDHFDVGRMVVAPFLWHSKITHIDTIILSHPEADHMNGLRFIVNNFHPKEFWYNGDEVENEAFRELMDIIGSKKTKRLLPKDLAHGMSIEGAWVRILHPLPGTPGSDTADLRKRLNNNSLVVKISYGGRSFLFPGDLEASGEQVLISNKGPDLKSDILLSPHHGSRNSNSAGFLGKVKPRICIISSGKGNSSNFPHKQTLKRLGDIGCRVIRIDKAGAVRCTVGPDRFEVKTYIGTGRPP